MTWIKKIFLIFLIWRVFLFLPLLIGNQILDYRQGYEYTRLWKFITPYFPVDSFFLYPFANFDGVHYLSIAGMGYSNNAGFFPFYPLLIKTLTSFLESIQAFGAIQFFSALFISNLAFFLSLLVFYKLIRLDFPDKIAYSSIIFLLAFPTSFYFGAIYTESLFLLFALLSFYFARKNDWKKAGIFAMFLSATRLVGIAIFPVLIYMFVKNHNVILTLKGKNLKKIFFKFLPLFLSPLGLVAYALFNKLKWNEWFYFISAQGQFANQRSVDQIVPFPQTAFRYFKLLFNLPTTQYEWWVALLELMIFFWAICLFYFALKKKVNFSYILFSVFCFLVPVSSGTISGFPRYVLPLFPLFITLPLILNGRTKIIYLTISGTLLFILLMFFSKGYFVA